MMRWLPLVALTGCLADVDPPECKSGTQELAEINTGDNESGPWLSPDRRELFFESNRTGPTRIYHATRDIVEEPFGEVTEVLGLPDGAAGEPFLESDGVTLWFIMQNDMLWRARRPNARSFQFVDAAPVTIEGLTSIRHPSLTADGLTLYVGGRDAGMNARIYRATRPSRTGDDWTVTELDEIRGTLAHVYAPSIGAHGERLLFAGTTDPNETSHHIYESDWRGNAFAPGVLEEDVQTSESVYDGDPMLHAGGDTILFASNRNGDFDLFIACP